MKLNAVWSKTKNGLRKHLGSGIWHVNATINGRGVNETTKTADKAGAWAFKEALLASRRATKAQDAPLAAAKTLKPFIAEYRRLTSLESHGDLTTARKAKEFDYIEKRWEEHRKRPLAGEDPRDLNLVDLLEFQKFLAQHYIPLVVNRYVRLLIQVLELAEDSLPAFRSPHHSRIFKTLPVGAAKPLDLPTEEQFRAVLARIRAEPSNRRRQESADFAEGLAYSNLRSDEARRLRVIHVNLKAGCLDLPAEIVKGKKKGRTVPLGASALVLYKRLVEQAGPDGVIFKVHSCIDALTRACAFVGCQRLTPHKLRHWWATIALEKTGDVKQVAEWLGHKDGGKLVLATYTHTRDERAKALAAKLDFNWSAVVE